MGKVKFAVVENDPLAIEWLRLSIEAHPDWTLLWTCDTRQAAFHKLGLRESPAGEGVQESHGVVSADSLPDLLLIDLQLNDGSAIPLIQQVALQRKSVLPVVITVFGQDLPVLSSIRAGAQGYLLKGEVPKAFANHVQALLNGQPSLSPNLARFVLKEHAQHQQRGKKTDPATMTLSARECEVLELLSKGYNNTEIANILDMSINTVKTHIRSIYAVLQVSNRMEAAGEARHYGFIN